MFALFLTLSFLATIDISTPCSSGTDRSIRAELIHSSEPCNHGEGEVVQIGLRRNNILFPKITLCAHPFEHTTFWTKHSLSKTVPCDEDFPTEITEKDKTQFPHLRNVNTDEFSWGFLIPKCDFDSEYEQEQTFNVLNRALFFKKLHQGNWRKFENFLRDRVNEDIGNAPVRIITGVFGLSSGGSLPKYVFKIVVTFVGIQGVYVGANSGEPVNDTVCDVIPDCGWLDEENGQIVCCELTTEFLARVGLEEEDIVY